LCLDVSGWMRMLTWSLQKSLHRSPDKTAQEARNSAPNASSLLTLFRLTHMIKSTQIRNYSAPAKGRFFIGYSNFRSDLLNAMAKGGLNFYAQ
jgi:hypothetical protein